MGTSQSNPGPNGRSPLVPPWADDEPEEPLPKPPDRRFQQFRLNLGKFVQNGSSSHLRSALGSYSRTSYGGGNIASRRLGSVNKAGAGLFRALSQGRVASPKAGEPYLDLTTLTGEPCLKAITTLADFLAPNNGDGDKIRASMIQALSEALDGMALFDMSQITDEVIINTMISYLSENIILLIVNDGGQAWSKAETPIQEIRAENSLRELVRVIVDQKMATKLDGDIRAISQNNIIAIQREAVSEVWVEWARWYK